MLTRWSRFVENRRADHRASPSLVAGKCFVHGVVYVEKRGSVCSPCDPVCMTTSNQAVSRMWSDIKLHISKLLHNQNFLVVEHILSRNHSLLQFQLTISIIDRYKHNDLLGWFLGSGQKFWLPCIRCASVPLRRWDPVQHLYDSLVEFVSREFHDWKSIWTQSQNITITPSLPIQEQTRDSNKVIGLANGQREQKVLNSGRPYHCLITLISEFFQCTFYQVCSHVLVLESI